MIQTNYFSEFDAWYARSYLSGVQEETQPSMIPGPGAQMGLPSNQKMEPAVRFTLAGNFLY